MQPLDVKLAYRNHPWCTVRLEVGHNEIGDADECEIVPLPQKALDIFAALNFPEPRPVPLMPLPFQIAQKLHGLTQDGSSRVRDLIDLQLIAGTADFNLAETTAICRRLFKYRKMQPWPPSATQGANWDTIYAEQMANLPVLPTVEEAVAWANDLIARIDAAG